MSSAFAAFGEGFCPLCLDPLDDTRYCTVCTLRWLRQEDPRVIYADRGMSNEQARAAEARRAAHARP